MLKPGVYPASVTPMTAAQKVDPQGLAKVLAWFESAGCQGAVLAGTNGEGPSLSATEKRDLVETGSKLKGGLDLILGIATPSLDEANWLCRRAADSGASAVLVMPPGYFREASESGIEAWFTAVLEGSTIPVLVYNFPQRTGITLGAELIRRLGRHSQMTGVKDSSGEEANLAAYRQALPEGKSLFVGNETLLLKALENGWTGTISGAANCVPHWLCQIVKEWFAGDRASAEEKFKILFPVLEAIRRAPQPAGNKGVLHGFRVLPDPAIRLPLLACPEETVAVILAEIERATGLRPDSPMPPAAQAR